MGQKRPATAVRVRSNEGTDWIVDDVLRSGVDTYTVTCVAPADSRDMRERTVAYLRRDWEFVAATLFWCALVFALMSQVMNVWCLADRRGLTRDGRMLRLGD